MRTDLGKKLKQLLLEQCVVKKPQPLILDTTAPRLRGVIQ